jgi:aspartyl-tRNA(Asn)/glutamyl-tRNA(Gln) amidotransferase subunit C
MSDPLSREEVVRIAALAHLELTEEEVTRFGPQLADILGYVAAVQAVDTSEVAPTAHVLDQPPVDRPDVPTPSLSRRDALANAPEAAHEAGFFKVPRVLG